jgi:predicted TIM-barrel fold metal-dependent hydrolase
MLAHHAHVFPESINPDGTIDRLLRLMDACEIEQCVCFAPFPHQAKGTLDNTNEWLARSIQGNVRFYGFGVIDPGRSDLSDQVKRIADLGFRGIKLHPNTQDFDVLSKPMFDVYAAAQEMKLFLTFHTGVHQSRLMKCALTKWDEIAWEFPELKFSMEHVGGYHFFNEALAVIFNHVPPPWDSKPCHVFAGLASIFCKDRNRFWYISDEQLRELAAQVGVRQLIFGLDFPYNLEAEARTAFDRLRNLFNEEELAQILGGNLRRELGLT